MRPDQTAKPIFPKSTHNDPNKREFHITRDDAKTRNVRHSLHPKHVSGDDRLWDSSAVTDVCVPKRAGEFFRGLSRADTNDPAAKLAQVMQLNAEV